MQTSAGYQSWCSEKSCTSCGGDSIISEATALGMSIQGVMVMTRFKASYLLDPASYWANLPPTNLVLEGTRNLSKESDEVHSCVKFQY